jgi:CheY-like chemotaxis protein
VLKLLLVSPDKGSWTGLASGLEKHGDVDLSWAESGSSALDVISQVVFDLVVTDENLGDMTALEFAAKLPSINPMINCALVSSLSPQDFHEASEGLGVLAQLSLRPGEKEAQDLIARLKILKNPASNVNLETSQRNRTYRV